MMRKLSSTFIEITGAAAKNTRMQGDTDGWCGGFPPESVHLTRPESRSDLPV
jgi:hypothetical protein